MAALIPFVLVNDATHGIAQLVNDVGRSPIDLVSFDRSLEARQAFINRWLQEAPQKNGEKELK